MERLGLQRAAAFSWKKSARATLDVYQEVVSSFGGILQPVHARAMAASREP
jgi:hypothetical protein